MIYIALPISVLLTTLILNCYVHIQLMHSLGQNHTHCIAVPHVQVAIKKLTAAKYDYTDHW